MKTRYYALILGLVLLVGGILGFVPGLLSSPPPSGPPVAITAYHGLLFGLFPVNMLENLGHIALGLWGIAAWRSLGAGRIYARSSTIIHAVLAVFGLIPALNTLFGLAPLYANEVWLHAVFAIVSAYFGWVVIGVASPQNRAAGLHR